MNYFDVEELLVDIIKKYPEVESAEAQFLSLLEADEEQKENFTEWCMSKGYNERKAFLIFYQDYISREDTIWDSIFPNKEEYDGYKQPSDVILYPEKLNSANTLHFMLKNYVV